MYHIHIGVFSDLQYTFISLLIGRCENLFTWGNHICPREIWFLRVNKFSYLPIKREINVLFHYSFTKCTCTFCNLSTFISFLWNIVFFVTCVIMLWK